MRSSAQCWEQVELVRPVGRAGAVAGGLLDDVGQSGLALLTQLLRRLRGEEQLVAAAENGRDLRLHLVRGPAETRPRV